MSDQGEGKKEWILNEGQFAAEKGTLWEERGDGAWLLGCGKGNAARAFWNLAENGEIRWEDYRYLSVDVKSLPSWSLVFQFEIWEKGNEGEEPDLTVRMSMIPQEEVRLVLPFEALDAQHIFLGRTPGKLRSFVTGKAVRPERIGRFAIGLREGWEGQQIEIRRFALSWEQPDCPFSGKPLVDLLGQKKEGNWPGKRSSVEDLKKGLQEERQALLEEEGWKERSSYGGYTGLRFSATGYFRLEKTESHWWLVDPEGCAFLTAGMDCVRTDECTPIDGLESCYDWLPEKGGEYDQALRPDPWMRKEAEEYMNFPVANLIRCFGADWRQEWERLTVSRLRSWGFNTIGAFSDEDFIRRSNMPYTRTLVGYPSTRCKIYRDFPDVFSQEYLESAKAYAAQLNEGRNDANMIGYYMRNEPQWAFSHDVCLAEELLGVEEETETGKALLHFLEEKYGGTEALYAAWELEDMEGNFRKRAAGRAAEGRLTEAAREDLKAFSARMIREYVRVPALELKKVDPNHLNLGMRYAFILYPEQTAGCEFMDVFSINCYKIDPTAVLTEVAALVKMPVMIGEFHFGALDRGLDATGIIGVADQESRGKAYRYYLNHALHVPECVGVQYFEYWDQPFLGRPDGENYQIGFLDVCGTPYAEMVRAARLAHAQMYHVAAGLMDYMSPAPEKIISNIAS